jgi:hypothetical protein
VVSFIAFPIYQGKPQCYKAKSQCSNIVLHCGVIVNVETQAWFLQRAMLALSTSSDGAAAPSKW